MSHPANTRIEIVVLKGSGLDPLLHRFESQKTNIISRQRWRVELAATGVPETHHVYGGKENGRLHARRG